MPKTKRISIADAVAHVVDVVATNHKVRESTMRKDLQALGFAWGETGDIIWKAVSKKLIRSDGSQLSPLTISTKPHVAENDMTGWWGIYIDGKYAGQRPDRAQAEQALQLLLDAK